MIENIAAVLAILVVTALWAFTIRSI